ncbi:hypothetical protein BD310DRAFT_226481 [Dichomitus squalens]|uniref:Uncharacterized protein n=1 Tax=Dichomitus squalens TaxID=114155 RepID=A0A4Q9PHT2_9APHY|nr:hypothetical protein BD310DRAFT_226481 [Dichomitus squalens]
MLMRKVGGEDGEKRRYFSSQRTVLSEATKLHLILSLVLLCLVYAAEWQLPFGQRACTGKYWQIYSALISENGFRGGSRRLLMPGYSYKSPVKVLVLM